MIKLILLCCSLPLVVKAGFAELSGTLHCKDCLDCGPVNGVIELWEGDILSSDDFQAKKPIVNGKYEGLELNEFEWTSTSPYYLIKHTCHPLFWLNGKRLPHKIDCYVETKYSFDEPSKRYTTIDLDLRSDGLENKIVC